MSKRTPTFGYEDNVQISKREIAETQLVEAISLFLSGNYVCAITLAGAAEEIFARLVNAQGATSAVESSFEVIQTIREKIGLEAVGEKPKKTIFNEWNAARNELKHYDKDAVDKITINLFDEACWMIRRALANAMKIEVQISNAVDFENWIIININL